MDTVDFTGAFEFTAQEVHCAVGHNRDGISAGMTGYCAIMRVCGEYFILQ